MNVSDGHLDMRYNGLARVALPGGILLKNRDARGGEVTSGDFACSSKRNDAHIATKLGCRRFRADWKWILAKDEKPLRGEARLCGRPLGA